MRKSVKTATVPETLKLMQSLLWYNDIYQVFFSTHKTNNPQEYYCFILDIKSGLRRHGYYRLTTDAMLVDLFDCRYSVKHLVNMRIYDINMIQLTNVENELDYWNWCGVTIPVEKGKPYELVRKTGSATLKT